MNMNRFLIMALAVLALTLGGHHEATAQRKAPARGPDASETEIRINFIDTPILQVIERMSEETGKNFILESTVRGTVTVIAPKPFPKSEAYGVFESILEMNGFSLVPQGNIIKVVPSQKAIRKSIPVVTGRGQEAPAARKGDQIVTQLIPILYSDAQAIAMALTPLISASAKLTPYANTNTIILTDTISNIARLLEIVREIDIPGFEEKITIIPLVNAEADVLSREILQALDPGSNGGRPTRTGRAGRRAASAQPVLSGAAASQIKIIPDLRTNSLIVVANEVDTEQVEFLVRELDKMTPIEANNIHVYRLKNALAEDVAAVITSLAGQSAPAGQPGGGAAATGAITTFYKQIAIVADKTTNALIIIASPQDYVVLKGVIDQLDIMRPQVLVETLIAEVSLDFTRNLGVRWQVASGGGDPAFVTVNQAATGGSIVGNLTSSESLLGLADADLDLGSIASLIPAFTPGGISTGYLNIDADILRAFVEFNAAENNSDFNVLSAPHILTLDNEKAVINISDNVPFITSRLSDNTGSDVSLATSETFEYRDVGIVLEITPHISPDRMVRLEIVQKVNDVSLVATGLSAGALSEIKREAQTTVMVKDRHTLVLGGLMKDTDNVTISKVPFLGDIPFLGWAFKSKSTTRGKTNLLIFITPSIVTSVAEATEVTLEKSNAAGEELLERMKESPTIRRTLYPDSDAEPADDAPEDEPGDILYEAGPK